ncbi:methyltransferase domain-containing protein [Paenibacillus protaetiae]|uniref:methyltransferase domain-containing protein n=1 Tax=Paenibacillus protaetiae TaxID=2509456 RepID=UPI0013EA313E|nr:methyltransferase domain-containing protein [Paenibacillus protaetiae]
MKREYAKEWLDEAELELPELERSLREVWHVNRYLGGNPALYAHMEKMVAKVDGGKVRVLDVATGLADIPVALLNWRGLRGRHVSISCVDIHPQMIALAAKRTSGYPEIEVSEADGTALPYDDNSFHIAICNLALHHLDEQQSVKLLSEMNRVASIGWIVTDLERRRLAYWSAKLLAGLVWRSPVTRHDGPLSVRRSYTASEARELLRQAGIAGASVHKHFPFRLALVGHG